MSKFVTLAVLVDSSLTLGSEWPTLQKEYLQPINARVSELHPKSQVRGNGLYHKAQDTDHAICVHYEWLDVCTYDGISFA